MDKQSIVKIASEFIKESELNYISNEIAISEELVGMKIFEEPLFAFGSVDDENFKLLKDPNAIGEHFLLPNEWLHGRIEGQILIKNLCLFINSKLNEANYESIIPTPRERKTPKKK